MPPEPELPLLHSRDYDVRAYEESPDRIRLRGVVRDEKPPGMFAPEDPDPLTIHHMVVDVVVSVPSMEIVEAEVVFETHPHDACPSVTEHYRKLVGLSIARGFTHRVRELFGGPRGCTHTTALLQAMAPVAIQCLWSLRTREEGAQPVGPPRRLTKEEQWERFKFNLDTCHVWADGGEMIDKVRRGEPMQPPKWIIERFEALGKSVDDWQPVGD